MTMTDEHPIVRPYQEGRHHVTRLQPENDIGVWERPLAAGPPRAPWPALMVLGIVLALFGLLFMLDGPAPEEPLPVPPRACLEAPDGMACRSLSTTTTVPVTAGYAGNGNCDQACQAWFRQQQEANR